MRPVGRRSFVKKLALVTAATAGSAVVPDLLHPAGAAFASQARAAPVWLKAPCRLCGVGCGLLVGVENRRTVGVKGDPASSVGAGLACVKGYLSVQALTGRDRITRAMIRRDGILVPVPLGEALDLVARAIRETAEQHGKDSIAVYGSAQWTIPDAYVASKLFKGGLGTNNVETSTRLYATSAMAGLESSFGLDGALGCYQDIDHADVIVLWDANLAETDPVLFSRMLAHRRRNPAVRIIDLATRTTRTSYAADKAALYQPHGALAIGNAICREIVARKWVDRDFIDRYVAFKSGKTDFGVGPSDGGVVPDEPVGVGWDAYVESLSEYTPEHVEGLSGVPAATIRWLASLYGDPTRKVMSVWGPSTHQDVRGSWANNVLYNIHLLVGKIATPGNSPFALTGQPSGGCSVHDAGTLTGTLPRGAVSNAEDRRRAAKIWGVPADRIDPRPGRVATSMFQGLESGEIRFLWIQATNPMLSLPNVDRYRRAAGRADRFIVVSEAYPTPTTDVADVVLPAAIWVEREGIYANAERRVQHFAKMVPAPGDGASDAWHMIQVGRRLGLAQLFPWEADRHVEQIWEEYRRFHENSPTALPPMAALRAHAGAMWPYLNGRETTRRYSAAEDSAADRARGDFDFYGHPDHKAWIWIRPYQPPAESPDDRYPLWLVAGSVLEHWGGGSLTQRIPTLHTALPHAYVEINPDDAKAKGIRHGDRVRLTSRRGALEIEARLDYRSQPPRGHVFVPTFDEAAPVNRLMGDAWCPLSGQPDGRKCAVRIERLNSGRSE